MDNIVRIDLGTYWLEFQFCDNSEVILRWWDPLRNITSTITAIPAPGTITSDIQALKEIAQILHKMGERCHPTENEVTIMIAARHVNRSAKAVYDTGEQVCNDPSLAFSLGMLMGAVMKEKKSDE